MENRILENLYLRYPITNEPLESVVAGLDPSPTSRVLAICGSGDVPFALSEYAGSVSSYDISEAQILFANRRKDALLRGDNKSFFGLGSVNGLTTPAISERDDWLFKAQRDYFETRLKLLRPDSVSFSTNDILSHPNIGEFDSFYLSNIADYGESGQTFIRRLLFNPNIKKNSRIYFTRSEVFELRVIEIPVSYEVNQTLTCNARQSLDVYGDGKFSQYWTPFVIQKL